MRFSSKSLHSIILVLFALNRLSQAELNSNREEKLLDEWAVHIDGGIEAAREYAARHGLILVKQVSLHY